MRALIFSILTLSLSWSAYSSNSQPLTEMMSRIVQLRSAVEERGRAIEALHSSQKSQLDALNISRQDLMAQLEKQKLRRLQAQEKIKHLRLQTVEAKQPTETDKKTVLNILESCQKWLSKSLPFRSEARSAELKTLLERLENKGENPELVLVDVVSWLESELKLSQSLEYRIMDISFDRTVKKVEVVRLGLAQMYTLTPDGKAGYYKNSAGDWTWEELSSARSSEAVKRLFAYYKQKKVSGLFELPLANPEENL